MTEIQIQRLNERLDEIESALEAELAKSDTSPAQWELVALRDLIDMVKGAHSLPPAPVVHQENLPGMNFADLQREVDEWSEKNFGYQPSENPFLGVVEELGELAHAMLKMKQEIRGSKDEHLAAAKDAVADLVIFLADYCSKMRFNLQEIVESTWAQVKKRDWKKDPQNGGEAK